MAGAGDGGSGRRDGRGKGRQGSPPRASGLIERCAQGASLVPLMLLSAAAADTLHAPADINLVSGLSGIREARAMSMFAALRSDQSTMAIRAEDQRLLEMCELAVQALGDKNDEPTGNAKSAWKAWLGFCSWAGVLPWRTEAAAALGTDETARMRETVIWINALLYIYPRMKPAPGRKEHPKPASALAILQHVRRMHTKLDIPIVSLKPCVRVMKKLIDAWIEHYDVESLQPRRKAALTAELIVLLLGATSTDPTLGVGDRPAWVAMWHLLAQSGMRKAEVALADGARFGKFDISWDNIKWRIGGATYPALTPALRAQMRHGDFLIVRPPPSKADPFALRWGINPIYLPYEELAPICAARAVADLEILRRPPSGSRAKTPLFATAAGEPLRRNNVSKRFDAWMADIGAARGWADGDSKKFSVHSFRIHLACALAAAGASDSRIQAMLRWASVDALLCYKQTKVEEYGAWISAAGVTSMDVNRSHHLPRDAARGAPPPPQPEVAADQMTAERAFGVRFEADDIIAAAQLTPDGLSGLMAEAGLLDREVGAHDAPDDELHDLLDTSF